MPENSLETNCWTIPVSSTKRFWPPPRVVRRRAAANAVPARSRARYRVRTHPCPRARTMKLRLLFWMRGNGRAGSSARGDNTGSTSRSKYCSSHWEVCASQEARASSSIPCWRRAGSNTSLRQAYCALTRLVGALVNRLQLLGDGEPVGAGLVRPELDALLESGDADFEELVEVVRRDAQELQPLEQRYSFVQRLCEYPLIECEQRKLAIDVVFCGTEIGQVHGRALSEFPMRPQRRAE